MSARVLALGLLLLGACSGEVDDTLDSIDTDAAEPNNTRALAFGLLPPALVHASLDSAVDADWYMFEASHASQVRIAAADPSLELYLELEDTQGHPLASWDTGSRGAEFLASLPPQASGTLYLKVYSAYVHEIGSYQLSIR